MPADQADPIEQRKVLRKEGVAKNITFGEVAEVFVRDVGSRKWKSEVQREEFERVIATYCGSLVPMRVQEITVADVKKVLIPWIDKRPTAVALTASVIRRVIDTAIANEWRPQASGNPAAGEILGKVIVLKHKTTHWPSMPWEHASAFYRELAALVKGGEEASGRSVRNLQNKGRMAMALQLLMLTALRKNEVLGLRWDEVDLDARVLRIRAERMKAGKEHVVPLSTEAMRILEMLADHMSRDNRSGISGVPQGDRRNMFVFPSPRKKGQPLDGNAFLGVMKDCGGGAFSVHGFRATFRTWVEDMGHDAVLAEHALAHSLSDAVQKAYRRGTALERRRELMQLWSDNLASNR